MTYAPKIPTIQLPKETPNNRSILSAKFAIDMLTGGGNLKSLDRAVRVGELIETGLFTLSSGGLLVPKDELLIPEVKGNGENLLLNPDLSLWQRGTTASFVEGVSRTADAWYANGVGHKVRVIQRVMPTGSFLSNTYVPQDNPPTFLRMEWQGALAQSAGRFAILQHRVEAANRIVGKEMVLSMWMRSDVARTIGVDATLLSNNVSLGSVFTQKQLGTDFSRISFKFKLPYAATVAATANIVLELTWWCEAGTTWWATRSGPMPTNFAGAGWIEVMAAKLEEGDTPTPFSPVDPVVNLLRCMRLYEKSYNLATVPGTVDTSGRICFADGSVSGGHYRGVQFKVRKVSVPSVVVYSAQATSVAGKVSQNDGSTVDAGIQAVGTSGFEFYWTNPAGLFGGWIHYTAEANL